MIVFTFPGQGSQKLGMGKDLYENSNIAKEVFQNIDDALNFKLSNIMFEDKENTLSLTNNTQPALMALSMALLEIMKQDFNFQLKKHVSFVAGHSLGEYTALCASESFDIPTTAKLLQKRGLFMLNASKETPGAMAAVLGKDIVQVQALIDQGKLKNETLVVANDNIDGQIVISGHVNSVENTIKVAKEQGIKIIKLPVSGAFHSPLMQNAQHSLESFIADVQIKNPVVPIISNVIAKDVQDSTQIKELLIKQVTGTVRWRETLEFLTNKGVDTFVELGSGNVLTNLAKKAYPNAKHINIQNIADIENFVKTYVN